MARVVLGLVLLLSCSAAALQLQRAPARASSPRMFFDKLFDKGEKSPFEALTIDEKVAVVRVAKCIGENPQDSVGPLSNPSARPEWATPSEEVWAAVRQEYSVLEKMSDETLEVVVQELRSR